MSIQLTSEQVWQEIGNELFAVLGMVNKKGEARTVGIVYIVHEGKLYIASGRETWKVRYMAENKHVSLTVPIAKRIPFLPWIKIPAATITFSGTATICETDEVGDEILEAIFRGSESDSEMMKTMCVIEVEPKGDFITYGVGIPMMAMREPEKARGRAPTTA